ncbi:hypothetical protein D3C72_1890280 [compost metagenome]
MKQAPQRLGSAGGIRHHERQLDDRAARKALAFRAAQPQCDVDHALLDLRGLVAHVAQRRTGIQHLHPHPAARSSLKLARPRFNQINLEEALRPQEVRHFQFYRFGADGQSA